MKKIISRLFLFVSAVTAIWLSNFARLAWDFAERASHAVDAETLLGITRELAILKTMAMLGWVGYAYGTVVLAIILIQTIAWLFEVDTKDF